MPGSSDPNPSSASAGAIGRHSALLGTLGALTAAYLALFLRYLQGAMIRQPFWDMYAYILHYLQFRSNGRWWTYLWELHDLHRPAWSRLLIAIDIELFSGSAYPFIVSTTALQATTACLLWRECRRGVPGEIGRAVGYLVLMLTLTSVAAVDCAVPIECAYPQALVFSVLAIVCFSGSGEGANGRSIHWRRSAALAAGVAAALGNAVGLAIWPILLWTAWRGRAGRTWMAVVAAVGSAFILVYLGGQWRAVGGSAAGGGSPLSELLERLNYLITYLGLPWTRAAALVVPGRIAGACLLGAGLWVVVVRGFLRQPAGRLERIAVALILFSLASAALATAGRVDVARANDVLVPVRYSVLLTPLHVGLLWIAAPALGRLWGSHARRPAMAAGLVAAGAVLLVQQVAAGQAALATTARMRAAIERFEAGESEPDMTKVIFDDLDQARRELKIIQDAGLFLNVK